MTCQEVAVKIKSMNTNFKKSLECMVLPHVTEKLPQTKLDCLNRVLPATYKLADPNFTEPSTIDLLIGAATYWKILIGAPRNHLDGQPALQNTQLGWILGGELAQRASQKKQCCLKVTNEQLQQQLERFWKQETMSESRLYSKEERYCEKQFSKTIQRDERGRFILKLSHRTDVDLEESQLQAKKRLEALERKLAKQPELRVGYCEFMKEYEKPSHMTLVIDYKYIEKENYFIPHQAVV